MTYEQVDKQINQIVMDYEFPVEVLKDVNKRLSDSSSVHYAQQQLRYLVDVIEAGLARPRVREE